MKYRYRESHEMKDSGVEWLGMIPKEWEVSKIGQYFQVRSEKVSDTEYPALSVSKNGIVPQMESVAKTDNNDNRKKVCINDFVINSRADRKGSCGVSKLNGSVSLIAHVLKISEELEPNYIHYLFRNYYFSEEFYRWGTGIVDDLWSTNIERMKKINIPFFFKENQQKIADFLDKKCEEFDSVIAKKEMLINKLEEAKKSLISEVVTGKVKVIQKENGEYGIIKREAHEMKDSGVEWLGMIPKEWEVSKMKNKLIKFTDGAHISPEVENGVYPFLSVKDLKNGFLDFKNCLKTSIESYKYLKRNSCKPERGDLLISKDGTIGKTCLIDFDKEFVVASSLVIIKSNKNFSIKFLDYILQSEASQKQIFQYVKGAALPRISLELLKNIYIPFINQQDEQIKINNLLDKKCSQFDIAIEKQKEIIEKLKLAKQSLISEAVTGKIEIL